MSCSDYELQGLIGKGSFGSVFKVRKKAGGNYFVLKQIEVTNMSAMEQKEAMNEVQILSKFHSPYIVKYFDSFLDRGCLNIVMEYCEKGNLYQFLKNRKKVPLDESTIWKLFIQITSGLYEIHKQNILHRDLKSMNVFLSADESVRIGDFGVSKVLSHTMAKANTLVGTPYYLSPELCENKPYDNKTDIWSLGCILYELCTLKHPFEANNQGALILKIIRGQYSPIPKEYSSTLRNVIQSLLSRDPKLRPTAHQILTNETVQQLCLKCKIQNTFAFPSQQVLEKAKTENAKEVIPIQKISPLENNNKNIVKVPRVVLTKRTGSSPRFVSAEKQKEIDMVKNLPSTIKASNERNILQEKKEALIMQKEIVIEEDLISEDKMKREDDVAVQQQEEESKWNIIDESHNVPNVIPSEHKTMYSNSVPRMINNLLDRQEKLLSQMEEIRKLCIKRIKLDKFNQLLFFFKGISEEEEEDELIKAEKINKFVFGRISHEDCDIVQQIYQIIYLEEEITNVEKQIEAISK